MSSFIAALKSCLPEADWPVVVAALRAEPQIWAELQDTSLAEQVLQAAGADRDRWSPGFMGLLRLGEAQRFDSLRAAPMQSVAEHLRYQAAAVLEDIAHGHANECPTPDLAQATLLALALRERRRLLGSWDHLADDIQKSASQAFWQLPIVVLFGLIPNPQELLACLISPEQRAEIQQLGLHALISNPLNPDVQSAHLLELVRGFPVQQFLGLLRLLSNFNPQLAQQAALQALENLNDDQGEPNGFAEIQRLLVQAEVHQLSGQSTEADALLRSAWEASRQLETELASQVAEAGGADAETLLALRNVDPKATSKRPVALLAAAKVAFKSGDHAEAKELAKAALKAASTVTPVESSRHTSVLRDLADLFISLRSPEDALSAAEAATVAQPNDAETALYYSRLLASNGKQFEALQQAHLAAALDPQNIEARRNLAKALMSHSEYQAAYEEWKAALENEQDPTAEDWLSLAASAIETGETDEAIKACQYALIEQPASGLPYALIGKALIAQGDEGSAVTYLRRATELSPGQKETWQKLAELQLAQGNFEDALATLHSAQQFDEPTAKDLALQATAYAELGRFGEALVTYEKGALSAGNEGDAETAQSIALQLSALHRHLDRSDAALRILEAAYHAYPANPAIAGELGKLLVDANQPKRALAPLNQALQTDPEDLGLLMALARAQLTVNEFVPEAERILEIILARKDAPVEAKALIADAKALQGKYSESIKAFDDALKTSLGADLSWRKKLMLGKARSQAASGKPVAAISTLETFEKEQPNDLELQHELCICYQQAGRGDEAAQIAQRILLGKPQDEDTLVWYADLMHALGKDAEGCKALSSAPKALNQNPKFILGMAKLQWSGESPDAAQKTLAQLMQLEDANPLTQAARFLLEKEAANESIPYFRRAMHFAAPDFALIDGLAHAYIQTAQWSNALDALNQALRIAPQNVQVLKSKVQVLLELERPQAALESLEAALQLAPDILDLLALKARILRNGQDWSAALDAASKAFELDPGHLGNLQDAAELAVISLQTDLARTFFAKAGITAKPDLDLACLQAELALDAGQEIEAAKAISAAIDESHPRVLAMQSRLASCRGDRSQAAQFLQKSIGASKQIQAADILINNGVARAAEDLCDWQTAISCHERLAKSYSGLILANFNLGRALLLAAEWQQLCEASHAATASAGKALEKGSRTACIKALTAAHNLATDSSILATISRWKTRAELRFGGKIDLSGLPPDYPASGAEAAALLAAARRTGATANIQERIKPFLASVEVMLEQAIAKDDPGSAFAFIKQAAAAFQRSAPVQAFAAQIAQKAGEMSSALQYILRALALWPEQANWHTLAGEIQQALGNLNAAIEHFKVASQLDPDQAKRFAALGNAQLAAHSLVEGIQSLERAVQMEPKRADHLLSLAAAFRTAGDRQQAKSIAQQARKLAPQDPGALRLQAELAMETNDAKGANQMIVEALKLAPKDPSLLRLLAENLHALGEIDQAVEALDRARETAKDDVPLLILRAQWQPGEGPDILTKLSQRYPDRPEVFLALSESLATAGSLPNAVQAAQHAVKKAGRSSDPGQLASYHLHLGILLRLSGNLDQSLHHLDQAAKLAPHSAASHLERGRVYLARRQQEQALSAFHQAIALAPGDAVPHLEAGLALKEARDFGAAEAELRRAATLAPKDRHIQRQLAGVIALNIIHHPAESGAEL